MRKAMILAVAAFLAAGVVSAALTEADLAPRAVRTAMAAKPAAERQAFAREVIEAIAAQPMDDAAKTQALTSAARASIAGARDGSAVNVIAEIYNSTPVNLLQGVADLLAANNFGQTANNMTDAQFDAFCSAVVKSASQYIEASGSDSPAVRMSILAATFSKASNDPARTRPLMIAALPASVQAAAATYVGASERGNREVIAAAAGVDAVEPTPADPDAANVVAAAAVASSVAAADGATGDAAASEPAGEARSDYLEPQPPAPAATDGTSEPVVAAVPLLARPANDVLGLTLDVMQAAAYNWDTADPTMVLRDPPIGSIPGFANVTTVPGQAVPSQPVHRPRELPPPSPPYGNQRIR